MAIPHIIQKQLIKQRIKDKAGGARLDELRAIQAELAGYNTGPYGELKKWVVEQINKTTIRSKIEHRENFFSVEKGGAAQIAIVGPPNIGKSSLLNKLSNVQIKIADYEFTTLKPTPAIINFDGVEVQLIEIPGLIEGAHAGKGTGKALLAVVRTADNILFMCDAAESAEKLAQVIKEVQLANIKLKNKIIIANKCDLPEAENKIAVLEQNFPDFEIIPVSVAENKNINYLREKIWQVTKLIRIFTKTRAKSADFAGPSEINFAWAKQKISKDAIALKENATIADLARKIHKDFLEKFDYAKVWGKSAKFEGQRVGLNHKLEDKDIVEIFTKD